ncbi:MAG: DUF4363 domain-containing protein [Nostoc sp. DedQUE05]|uniref:DUF4363 domain-containing protein n=1 Tax=Nostoc sp. DedQUE05 TaxID=3075391 RepID=UPI002AD320B2|nr:DUF4363 domain-containing protein [Nostoc sp. DedQUE05]MDZ8096645.1 DUF4363 domain-containing protein [Nostoc sp. DedQUE05]
MNRFNPVLIVAAISMMTLVGCNQAEEPTAQTPPAGSSISDTTATPAATTTPSAAATPAATTEFQGLQGVVTNTKTAVEAGDFTKAKGEFDKFEDLWSKVEDGVKAKSPTTYKQIEDKADEIEAGLKASAPNKSNLSTALGVLNKDVTSVAKP